MTRRGLGLGLLMAGSVSAFFLIILSRPAQPAYNGKPANYWLQHLWNMDGNKEPFFAFKVMGSNAVPFLISVLEQKPSRIADRLDGLRSSHPRLPEFLLSSLPSGYRTKRRREDAAYVISQIGPPAAATIPTLLRITRDSNEDERVQSEAFGALLAMGGSLADLVPQFIRDLKSDDADSRSDALNLLRSAGPAGKPAVPLIFELLNAKRVEPYPAARALWSIARLTNTAIEILTNGLPFTNSARNELAIYYLGEMGTAAANAAPAVIPLLESPISSLRMQAEKLLREIAPAALESKIQEINARQDASVARIISILQSDERDSSTALKALQVLGPAGKAAVPALIEKLQRFSSSKSAPSSSFLRIMEQVCLTEALAEIGPDARSAVPAMIAVIHQGYGQMFFKALGRIGPDARDAVPLLESGLLDKDFSIRLTSADALTRIAPQECSNAVAVLEALKFDEKLATIWLPGTNPGPFMVQKQDFDNPTSKYYRLAASVPLWRLGFEKQSPMLELLKQLEQSRGHGDEKQYIELLGDLGAEAKPALPKLATFLQQSCVSDLRRAAASAIRRIDSTEAMRLGLPGLLAVP